MDIRLLREDDDRSSFSCGDADLDRFFRNYAAHNQYVIHVGVTYVAVEGKSILGFATVSPGGVSIEGTGLAKVLADMPRYPLPILRLARLGVDTRRQKRGVGTALLASTFDLALQMSTTMGCVGVLVDAKPEAIAYYRRFGFMDVHSVSGQSRGASGLTMLFLPIDEIRNAAGQPTKD